tara:strand:+ start:88 stop:381 length:294 start_codon:yes stop_codon:yes gene_type:complete
MNAEGALISYLNYRKYENVGFIKYGNFKKIISFVLDCNNDYYIRKLFLNLIHKNYLIKKKNTKKSYLYKFNPNPKSDSNIHHTESLIDPNRFTITWD